MKSIVIRSQHTGTNGADERRIHARLEALRKLDQARREMLRKNREGPSRGGVMEGGLIFASVNGHR